MLMFDPEKPWPLQYGDNFGVSHSNRHGAVNAASHALMYCIRLYVYNINAENTSLIPFHQRSSGVCLCPSSQFCVPPRTLLRGLRSVALSLAWLVVVMMAAHCLMSRAACCLLCVFAVRVQPPRSTLPACLPAPTQGLPPSPQQCLNSLCVEDWVVVFIWGWWWWWWWKPSVIAQVWALIPLRRENVTNVWRGETHCRLVSAEICSVISTPRLHVYWFQWLFVAMSQVICKVHALTFE